MQHHKLTNPPIKTSIGLLILAALLSFSGCDFLPAEATITPTLTATRNRDAHPNRRLVPSDAHTDPGPASQPNTATHIGRPAHRLG